MPPFRTRSSDAAMPPWPPLASCRSRARLSWWSSRRFWHHSCCCRCYGAPRKVREALWIPTCRFLAKHFSKHASGCDRAAARAKPAHGRAMQIRACIREDNNKMRKKMRSLIELFVILSVPVWCPEARFWSRKVGRRGETNRNQRKTKCVR